MKYAMKKILYLNKSLPHVAGECGVIDDILEEVGSQALDLLFRNLVPFSD